MDLSRLLKKLNATATYQATLNMCILWWKVWNQNYSTLCCLIPTMFCISYYLLKRTLAITCDNDLIPYSPLRRQQLDQEEFPS